MGSSQGAVRRGDANVAWFLVYVLGGGLVALGLLTVVLPGLLAATVVGGVLLTLLLLRGVGPSAAGVVTGLALPLLYVAWLNRGGPGEVCHGDSTSQSCLDAWNPWLWLAVAVVVAGIGIAVFVTTRRRTAARERTRVAAAV